VSSSDYQQVSGLAPVALLTPADVSENEVQSLSEVWSTPFVPPPATGVAVTV
jgi:hypothetical protein